METLKIQMEDQLQTKHCTKHVSLSLVLMGYAFSFNHSHRVKKYIHRVETNKIT